MLRLSISNRLNTLRLSQITGSEITVTVNNPIAGAKII